MGMTALCADHVEQVLGPYRLLKATPDQICQHWLFIRDSLMMQMPIGVKPSELVLANIQQALLAGRLHCWFLLNVDNNSVLGVCTTTVTEDTISGVRNLLIYSVLAMDPIPTKVWAYCYKVMQVFAKGAGCQHVIACTRNKRVLRLVKMLGGSEDNRFIELEVT